MNTSDVIRLIEDNQGDMRTVIDLINVSKVEGQEEDLIEVLEVLGIEARICSSCNRIMLSGYCLDDGMEYACSEQCLHDFMTDDEYEEAYADGEGDSYWTEWTELNQDGQLISSLVKVM